MQLAGAAGRVASVGPDPHNIISEGVRPAFDSYNQKLSVGFESTRNREITSYHVVKRGRRTEDLSRKNIEHNSLLRFLLKSTEMKYGSDHVA
jgi:hypothetical protein